MMKVAVFFISDYFLIQGIQSPSTLFFFQLLFLSILYGGFVG